MEAELVHEHEEYTNCGMHTHGVEMAHLFTRGECGRRRHTQHGGGVCLELVALIFIDPGSTLPRFVKTVNRDYFRDPQSLGPVAKREGAASTECEDFDKYLRNENGL